MKRGLPAIHAPQSPSNQAEELKDTNKSIVSPRAQISVDTGSSHQREKGRTGKKWKNSPSHVIAAARRRISLLPPEVVEVLDRSGHEPESRKREKDWNSRFHVDERLGSQEYNILNDKHCK